MCIRDRDDIKEITLSYSNVYMLWNQKGHSIIFNITLKDGSLAVSYTHLDVYKRQIKHIFLM